jgi:protoporphyrinogen/coproporphyrinogen III oxidase
VKRLVVIGGGISGTAAARTARTRALDLGVELEVVLLEKDDELGGKARSRRERDWLFEAGPVGYLNREPVVDDLVREAGLETDLVAAGVAQSHRFVFARGRVREVRATPLGFVTSGLLSFPGLLRAAREPWISGKSDPADESVWEFAARRLGPEFADRLIHPMVLGVFAGDAKRLSLSAAFPLMAELERDHGSLVRAQIARSRARKRGELPPQRSLLCSFNEGIQTLPRALVSGSGIDVRTGTTVESVRRERAGFQIAITGGETSLLADAVILASEGYNSATLLSGLLPNVSRALREIPHPPVYVVALGYGPEARERIPEGFGVLLPRDAGYRALGVTWDGYLFPRTNAEGGLLVRVLFGGSFDPEVAAVDPGEIVDTATREMSKLFGLTREPRYRRAKLWERAIPQYELGHGDRVRRIEEELRALPGLYLAGNSLYGTAFGKAAARGVATARLAVDHLRGRSQE